MKTSKNGVGAIKDFEGFSEVAYPCSAGVWTIGFGTTKWYGSKDVIDGEKIDKATALKLLQHDLGEFEEQVNRLVQVPLTQNQFDALVSFTYNVGGGALEQSTLLKKLNKGDYAGAAKQFMRWNKADGKVVKGLTNRRKREMELFSTYKIKDTKNHLMTAEEYRNSLKHQPDPNNTPLRNRDLPLPTAYQQHGVDSVEERESNPAMVTASAGGAIAGSIGIAEVVNNAPAVLSFLKEADYRVALVVVGVVVIGGIVYFVRRWWR